MQILLGERVRSAKNEFPAERRKKQEPATRARARAPLKALITIVHFGNLLHPGQRSATASDPKINAVDIAMAHQKHHAPCE